MTAGFLQPLPHPIGVRAASCSEKETILNYDQHFSWSGGKYTVTDGNGQLVISTDPQSGSLSQKKDIVAADGSHIFTVRRESGMGHATYCFQNPAGQRFLEMRNKTAFGKSKMEIEFLNTAGNGEPVHLELQGTWMTKTADITWNGLVCASLERSSSYFSSMGKGRYHVRIAPGADVILFAAIILGLDMSIEDKNKSGTIAGVSGVIATV